MDATRWIEDSRRTIEDWIAREAELLGQRPGSVEEAMSYSLTAGGKRLRPQLVLAAGEYLGIAWERLRGAALAVEYVHTYSLIHDDLPAMDNDDLRRGMPTSHKMFGEAMAILAGDALLTEAFVHMSSLVSERFLAEGVVAATHYLAEAAGRSGLVRGQVQDLAAEHQDISVDALQAIHAKKTAALFQASLAIPALLAGEREAAESLSQFGLYFGLAFQMVDDILNVVGDASRLGKATGTDAGLGKATYPRLLGIEAAKTLLEEHAQDARRTLDAERSGVLLALLQFAVERTW